MTNQRSKDTVAEHFRESVRVKEHAAAECGDAIVRAADLIAGAFRGGRKLLLCGNGGSAADSQHIAAEFVSVLDQRRPRPPLPAIALTTDTSFLTANANDFGFENVFARQVEALGGAGDVLIAISTSGKSPNVLAALRRARERGLKTVVLTGRSGGATNELGDVVIRVPSESTQHIQEVHITIGHIICELVEGSLHATSAGA
ncbi:MAG: SIS domain-containing protein [Gemmatimonadetes bacterium]|nr:SIS domain-containing protein [Gemmatimonadota bacterium]